MRKRKKAAPRRKKPKQRGYVHKIKPSDYINKTGLELLGQLILDISLHNLAVFSPDQYIIKLYSEGERVLLLPFQTDMDQGIVTMINKLRDKISRSSDLAVKQQTGFEYLYRNLLYPPMFQSFTDPTLQNMDSIGLSFYYLGHGVGTRYATSSIDQKFEDIEELIDTIKFQMILIGELLQDAYITEPEIQKLGIGRVEYKGKMGVENLMLLFKNALLRIEPVFPILWKNYNVFQEMITYLYRYVIVNSLNIKDFSEWFIDFVNKTCPVDNKSCNVRNDCVTDFSSTVYDQQHRCGRGNEISQGAPYLIFKDKPL